MFVATLTTNGLTYFLKGSVLTSFMARADKFDVASDAQAALAKAKKYYKVKVWKEFRILPADTFAPDYNNVDVFIAQQKAKKEA